MQDKLNELITAHNYLLVMFDILLIAVIVITGMFCIKTQKLENRIHNLEFELEIKNVAVYQDWSSAIQLHNDNK